MKMICYFNSRNVFHTAIVQNNTQETLKIDKAEFVNMNSGSNIIQRTRPADIDDSDDSDDSDDTDDSDTNYNYF